MQTWQARRLAQLTLDEDLASGDLTTESTVPPDVAAVAVASAKSELIACGAELFFAAFSILDPSVRCESHVAEGQCVAAGEPMWTIRGSAQALLLAERSALNLAQRASGVATLTRRFVRALPEQSKVRITDTRKTTPGLRLLERYAVRMGGGYNHRDNLGSAVLIKDNHIVAAGGIGAAVARARARAPHTCKIEVEVESERMLQEALQAGADIIMLDNFADDALEQAVALIAGRAIVEVSGNVSLERVPRLAAAGVDIISVGALTHSAPAADISLRLTL